MLEPTYRGINNGMEDWTKENMSGYQAPIRIVEKMQSQFQNKLESDVMRVVRSYGVSVDKEELLKALDYDRRQYEKGYRAGYLAGKRDAVAEICEECEVEG